MSLRFHRVHFSWGQSPQTSLKWSHAAHSGETVNRNVLENNGVECLRHFLRDGADGVEDQSQLEEQLLKEERRGPQMELGFVELGESTWRTYSSTSFRYSKGSSGDSRETNCDHKTRRALRNKFSWAAPSSDSVPSISGRGHWTTRRICVFRKVV